MTKSGITRRIDELGRIVIPKEMRVNLGIREGELLEIYIENSALLIKKFSQIENIKDISSRICNIISDICKIDLMITDREKVIVTSRKIKSLDNLILSDKMKNLIDNRECYISNNRENLLGLSKYFVMIPIITSTDCSGLIIVLSDYKNDDNMLFGKIVQKLLVDSLEVT